MTTAQKTTIAIAHIKHNGGRATAKQIKNFLSYPDQMIANLATRLGL
jgi:hypothetical protein